jgi:hypothetical protein
VVPATPQQGSLRNGGRNICVVYTESVSAVFENPDRSYGQWIDSHCGKWVFPRQVNPLVLGIRFGMVWPGSRLS